MPDQAIPPGVPPAMKNDLLGGLAVKFGEVAINRFFGNDVPEEDKAAILGDLVNVLEELSVINRYFAENIFNRFGDSETGELKRKPDVRDFLAAWSQATIRLMAEEEIAKAGGGGGEDEDGNPDEDGDGNNDGGGEEEQPTGDQGPVVDARFRRVQ